MCLKWKRKKSSIRLRALKLLALKDIREERSRAHEVTFCKPLFFLGSFLILKGKWVTAK